jgi:hypothetical protein
MICEGCGCTDTDACFDEETGGPCCWASINPPVCSVCARVAAEIETAAKVEVYSEYEAQDYIERRRAMSAGGIA